MIKHLFIKKAGAVHKVCFRSQKRNAIQEYVYILKNNVAVLIVWQTQRSKYNVLNCTTNIMFVLTFELDFS